MKEKDIKPIPKYIIKKIKKLDEKNIMYNNTGTRYYAYLTKIHNDIAHIVVACKIKDHQWFCKQVAVHSINSDNCYVKDIEYSLFGYSTGWHHQKLTHISKPYDDNKWYEAQDKYYNICCPIVNIRYALNFDKYKYSAIDKYKYLDIIKYLKIYAKYPQAEYLVKLNLCQFATNTTILKQIEKDKNFRKWIVKNKTYFQNEYGQNPYVSSKVLLFAYKNNFTIEKAIDLDEKMYKLRNDYTFKRTISEYISNKEIIKFIEYLDKQKTSCNSYADYLDACLKLNLDMTQENNKYPKNFKKWHDIRIDQYNTQKALLDQKERQELYEQFEKVANKYLSMQRIMNEDYVVILAKSPADLINEGNQLNHCVGRMNYDQKFIKEESLIFFVRDKSKQNKPFVTLEYSLQNNKILQCYAKNNSTPQEEVSTFINKKWLPYARRKLKEMAA